MNARTRSRMRTDVLGNFEAHGVLQGRWACRALSAINFRRRTVALVARRAGRSRPPAHAERPASSGTTAAATLERRPCFSAGFCRRSSGYSWSSARSCCSRLPRSSGRRRCSFDRRLVLLHRFTCFWASLYTWLNPAWRVRDRGPREDRPEQRLRDGREPPLAARHPRPVPPVRALQVGVEDRELPHPLHRLEHVAQPLHQAAPRRPRERRADDGGVRSRRSPRAARS